MAELLITWFSLFGFPEVILVDAARDNVGTLADARGGLDIQLRLAAGGNQSSNGIAERRIQILEATVCKLREGGVALEQAVPWATCSSNRLCFLK